MQKIKHTYKDGIFQRLFHDKETLLELYCALSGQNLPKDTEIEIVTLDNVIFGDRKNDLAFIVNGRLIILIEHQASISPNMPLRMLVYIAKEYEKLYFSKAIYSKQLVQIPTPELYVFYNGKEDAPLEQEMKLSDAFFENCGKISLEAVVRVINVNYEKGAALLKQCRTLSEYSQLIYMVRQHQAETGDLETAIKETLAACMERGILAEFLKENGGDFMSFLFEALTREECEDIREADGYARGREEGRTEGQTLKLIEQVRAKVSKKQSVSQIADALEESMDTISEIVALIEQHPEATPEELYLQLERNVI